MIGIFVKSTRYKGYPFKVLNDLVSRVEADGGTVEALSCTMANFRMPYFDYWQTFQTRVTDDAGVVEGADCFNQVIRDLKG